MSLRRLSSLALLLALSSAAPLAAQRPGPQIKFDLAGTAKGDLERGGRSGGEISVGSLGVSAQETFRVDDSFAYTAGFSLRTLLIDKTSGIALPEKLGEYNIEFGGRWTWNERWTGLVNVAAGFHGDLSATAGDALNGTLLIAATYTVRPELIFLAGVAANPFASDPVVPVIGVRWQFAPQWTLDLMSQPAVRYEANDRWQFFVGLEGNGGTFRVADDLGDKFGQRRLNEALLEVAESAVVAGFEHALSERLTLSGAVGWTIDRRFDYHRANFEYEADDGLFGRLALTASF